MSEYQNEPNVPEESQNLQADASRNKDVTYHYAYKDTKPQKQSNWGKNILLCVLVFALAVGGGYLGTSWALSKQIVDDNRTVLYQSVERTITNLSASSDSTVLSVKEIAALTSDSVVEISTEAAAYSYFMQQYVTSGSGSGVIISEDGYIVTCYHVIEAATKIVVRLTDGTEYEATVVGTDSENDIAVLKIEATGLNAAVYGDSEALQVGDTVVAIGNPLGELGGTVTSGIVSALNREITIDNQTMTLLQMTAAVNPGNSGGALFNQYGELIGIVNAKSSGDSVEGLGFAIPVNSVKSIIEDLISKGYVSGKRVLGISVVSVSSNQQAQYYGVSERGIYITDITEHSLAEEQGFQLKDRIISLNSIEVDSISDLQTLYRNVTAGESVTFKLERDAKEVTISFIKE